MFRFLLLALIAVSLAWTTAAVAAEVVARVKKPRGEMVDVGGHRLRLVCEGPKSATPVVWMEAGAFSGAADFAALQQKLAARGMRSCAYDRAGMGYSEAGPSPRDGDAITADFERLVEASGERGPFVLMGHSMAGLYVRQYAVRHPEKVAGLVLIDAVTPEMIGQPGAAQFVERMTLVARAGAVVGTLGLTKPFYLMGDRIGLPKPGRDEKRRGFISGRQSRAALAEVKSWRAAAQQTLDAGAVDPRWPVAVITAGPESPQMSVWNEVRQAPARVSQAGFIDNVVEADHRTVLGLRHGDRVVAGLDRVLAAIPAAGGLARAER